MEKQNHMGVKKLSIYQEATSVVTEATNGETQSTSKSSFSPGVTTMFLVSDIQEKYRNFVTKVKWFRSYAQSTEGTLKLSVIGASFLIGGVAAIQTKSTSKFYRKSLPLLSVTTATAVCYPYQSYEVAKKVSVFTYYGLDGIWRNANKLYTFTKTKLNSPKPDKKTESEITYEISENGDFKVADNTKLELVHKNEEVASSVEKETENMVTTDLFDEIHKNSLNVVKKVEKKSSELSNVIKFIPESSNKDSKLVSVDLGQSSPEDKDLYTTRL